MPKKEEDLEEELDRAAEEADEEDDEGEEDEGEEEEREDASDRPRDDHDRSDDRRPQGPPKKLGRPRKYKRQSPNPADHASASAGMAAGDSPEARAVAEKDVATIWNMAVAQSRKDQLGPEHIAISVTKIGIGPYPSEQQNMTPIQGTAVMGDEFTSPGEALVDYITRVYHLPTAKTAKLYRCTFWYRAGQHNRRLQIPMAELRLGPPEEVMAEMQAREAEAHRKAINDAVSNAKAGVGAAYRPAQPTAPYPPGQPTYPYPPPPGYAPYPPPYGFQPPPPIQGASPELEAMRREMATMMGAINERARLEGLAPPVAPTPAAPSAEERAAETARIVAQTLVGIGFTPQLAAKLNSPAMTPQAMQQSLVSPMEAWRESMKMMREFRQMDAEMREELAPEEEEKKVVEVPPATKVEIDRTQLRPMALAAPVFGGVVPQWAEKGEDEALASYITRLAMGNPEIALKFVEKLANSAFAQALPTIVQKLMGAGMPAVAAAMQAKQLNGANPPSQSQQIVEQPAPAPSWGSPKI